jgi:hypothetical protein
VSEDLPLRIVVVQRPEGAVWGVQSGRHDLIPPSRVMDDGLEFELSVRLGVPTADGPRSS